MDCPNCGSNGLKVKTIRVNPFDLPYSSYSCFERPGIAYDFPTEVSTNICDECGFSVTDEELNNPEKLAQKVKKYSSKRIG